MNRTVVLLGGLVVVAAVGGVLYWYGGGRRGPEPPAVPADVSDPPIRRVLMAKRAAVLANPLSVAAWAELAMAFDAHELWPEAQACYERAMALDPADARWPFLLGEVHNWRNKTDTKKDEAVKLYRLAAERSPPTPAHAWTAALCLGDLLTELDRPDEAAPWYEKAYAGDPANPWAAYRAARLFAERGRTEEAIKVYLTLTESPYARKRAAVGLAELYRRLGKSAEADRYERAAGELPADSAWPNPYANPVADLRRGRVVLIDTYFVQEKAQDGAGVVATATALADQYPSVESQLLLLRALVNTGDYKGAVAVAEDVLRAEPKTVTAHSFLGLARLGLADRAEAAGRKADAERHLVEAAAALGESVRLKTDYAPGYLYQAKALLRLGKVKEAETAARAGVASRPEEWEMYAMLADVLAAAGRKAEAVVQAEQAVKLAPPTDPRAKRALEALKK